MSRLTTEDWHRRFVQQAAWTQPLRRYLYQRVGLLAAQRIMEVGCGTGALLEELSQACSGRMTGLDLDFARLSFARQSAAQANLTAGDALALPFKPASFDLTLCHFLLLWLPAPLAGLREMMRVTRPGGAVLALAEPDYGGRIDYPLELARIGVLQAESLRRQGADPIMGRKLAGLLRRAGLEQVESGVLGGEWRQMAPEADRQGEWEVIRADLQDTLSLAELDRLQPVDQAAWQSGERVLFVPTFYAWGRVPV